MKKLSFFIECKFLKLTFQEKKTDLEIEIFQGGIWALLYDLIWDKNFSRVLVSRF